MGLCNNLPKEVKPTSLQSGIIFVPGRNLLKDHPSCRCWTLRTEIENSSTGDRSCYQSGMKGQAVGK